MAELSPASAGDAVARLLGGRRADPEPRHRQRDAGCPAGPAGERAENWPRFVLPSPALGIADRIRRHTAAGRPVWLYGHNMAAVSPSPFRNRRQPGSPPPLRLMRPSPCTTIPNA